MAIKYPAANGNWSTAANWNGGTLPGPGDTVYANGKTIVIDQDITIGGANDYTVGSADLVVGHRYTIETLGDTPWATVGASAPVSVGAVFTATGSVAGTGVARTAATLMTVALASPSILAGGGFTNAASRVVDANIFSGSSTCLTHTVGMLTLRGNVFSGNTGGSSSIYGVSLAASTTMAMIGNVVVGPTTAGWGVYGAGLTSVDLTGNITVMAITSGGGVYLNVAYSSMTVTGNMLSYSTSSSVYNIRMSSNSYIKVVGQFAPTTATLLSTTTGCTLELIGNIGGVISGTAATVDAAGVCVVSVIGNVYCDAGTAPTINTGGVLTVTGDVYGGSGAGSGISANASGARVTVNGNVFAGSASPAIDASTVAVVYPVIVNGSEYDHWTGVCAVSARRRLSASDPSFVHRCAENGSGSFITYTNGAGMPAVSDVRSGVTYNSGVLTGTCVVPPANAVVAGVPVSDTVGTAELSSPTAAEVAAAVRVELTPELARVAQCATVDSTGAQLASYDTA